MRVTHTSVEKLGHDRAWTYIDCFSRESTEHWVRIFAGKRYDTITALDELNLGAEKEYIKYRKDFIKGFTAEMKELIKKKKLLIRSDGNLDKNKKEN